MTLEIAIVFAILAVSLALFVSEVVRMDVVALLVLSALAVTGLVTPTEAFAGFSNAAVITVWAMFILSEGLSRAGVALFIGRNVMRVAGRSEVRLIVVIMVTAGLLSGFMNNIGVAALMLPVVVDISRRASVAPSRLLMPLAFGTLLGGLTTMIGTPPNLLISGALADAGLEPFGLFDFTPLGLLILTAGTAFMALVGRHLLPRTDPAEERPVSQRSLRDQYRLQARLFMLRIQPDSVLVGRTLSETRLSTAAGLIVIALVRRGRARTLPGRLTVLQAGDELLVQGRLSRFDDLRRWSQLRIERETPVLGQTLASQVERLELVVAPKSPLAGEPLRPADFRQRYGALVLAVRRDDAVRRARLSETLVKPGDRLLVQCSSETVEFLGQHDDFEAAEPVSEADLEQVYRLADSLFILSVPKGSGLSGETMGESRLDDAFDFRVLALFREGALILMPEPNEVVYSGDLILIQGQREDLDVLRGLQELEIEYDASSLYGVFESDRLQMIEATLDPRSGLAGQRVANVDFRERYDLELVAIWRKGQPYRADLDEMTLEFGDALLLLGPRQKLQQLGRERDFIVVSRSLAQPIDSGKAPIAAGLMLAVVILVLIEALPIAVAAVGAATLMILTRCLTMEEAYRAIEWRSVFLIAGMLPLGTAMQESGAAELVARGVMSALGEYGAWPVIGGLYAVTAAATMIIPTAALVVLMAPIVLSAAAELAISPQAAMMAIAMAASASFTSPISHPANVLVMGPGGYRFLDYLKLGVPLTLVVFVVVAVFLPWLWPLR